METPKVKKKKKEKNFEAYRKSVKENIFYV